VLLLAGEDATALEAAALLAGLSADDGFRQAVSSRNRGADNRFRKQ